MADVILAEYDCAICKPGSNVMSEVGVQHRQYGYPRRHTADAGDEVYCRFEAAREQSCPIALVRREVGSEEDLTHPVKNRFPILAPEKSNLLVGRRRLTISRFIEFKKLRMSSFFGDEMPSHRGWVDSTISCHSALAGA